MNHYLFLSLPFVLSILFGIIPVKPWFQYMDDKTMIYVSSFFLLTHFLTYKFQRSLSNSLTDLERVLEKYKIFVLLVFFILMLVFPFRNLSWGDGIILLETNLLETLLFGAQIAMDEILETSIHSLVFRILAFFKYSLDNRYSYQLISYLTGAIFLSFIGWKLKSKDSNHNLMIGSIFLSSSGFLVFFGYAENYSILSLYFLIFIYLIRSWILENKSAMYLLLGATILVTLGIYLHLVSGFLAFVLFYLWLKFSPPKKKGKHLMICSLVGGLLLIVGFSYLMLLHDPTLDRKSSHLLHPPLYPWKRLVSINHIIEILSVMWYNSKIPVFILSFFYIFERNKLRYFFNEKANTLVFVVFLSFFCNAFFINPMLGFPADWDMIGFYWIPLAYLSYLLLNEYPELKIKFASLIFFGLALQFVQAKHLSYLEPVKERQLLITLNIVYQYVSENEKMIRTLPKNDKKFFAKTDFFFFKSLQMTKRMCDFPKKEILQNELISLRKEFREGTFSGNLENKTWVKDFLTKATNTNTFFIKSLEEYNLCHLEL